MPCRKDRPKPVCISEGNGTCAAYSTPIPPHRNRSSRSISGPADRLLHTCRNPLPPCRIPDTTPNEDEAERPISSLMKMPATGTVEWRDPRHSLLRWRERPCLLRGRCEPFAFPLSHHFRSIPTSNTGSSWREASTLLYLRNEGRNPLLYVCVSQSRKGRNDAISA